MSRSFHQPSTRSLHLPPTSRRFYLLSTRRRLNLISTRRRLNLISSRRSLNLPSSATRPILSSSVTRLNLPSSVNGLTLPLSVNGLTLPSSVNGLNLPSSVNGLTLPSSVNYLTLPSSVNHLSSPSSVNGLTLPSSATRPTLSSSVNRLNLTSLATRLNLPSRQFQFTSENIMMSPTESKISRTLERTRALLELEEVRRARRRPVLRRLSASINRQRNSINRPQNRSVPQAGHGSIQMEHINNNAGAGTEYRQARGRAVENFHRRFSTEADNSENSNVNQQPKIANTLHLGSSTSRNSLAQNLKRTRKDVTRENNSENLNFSDNQHQRIVNAVNFASSTSSNSFTQCLKRPRKEENIFHRSSNSENLNASDNQNQKIFTVNLRSSTCSSSSTQCLKHTQTDVNTSHRGTNTENSNSSDAEKIRQLTAEITTRRDHAITRSKGWIIASKRYAQGQATEKQLMLQMKKLINVTEESCSHSHLRKKDVASNMKKMRVLSDQISKIMKQRNIMVLSLGSLMNVYQGSHTSESIRKKFEDLSTASSNMKKLLKQLKIEQSQPRPAKLNKRRVPVEVITID